MGFQLTIAEGKEAGREFVFEQQSVAIGRSSDCDVVLYDPGVSRRHARIFEEGDGFFVEDSGSANGTRVNGELVTKHALQDGDRITLGPVVFEYFATELPETDAAAPIADLNTRIVQVDDIKRQRNKGEALAPQGADSEALSQLRRTATTSMQALSRPRPAAAHSRPARTGPRSALGRASDSAAPAQARTARAGGERVALTAAERARIKRESGGSAKLKIFWLEASGRTRRLVYVAAGVLVLAAVGLLYWIVLAPGLVGGEVARPEPGILTRSPIQESFGLGQGVDFVRDDQKIFDFELITPVRAMALIHLQARDIAAGEVVVTCNAREVGQVPPDTEDSDRMLEIVVPASVLKMGEVNQCIFDNTRNPPGRDTWRIWNISIETHMLPERPLDQLRADAEAAFQRGLSNMERKDVGAENLYNAWKEFREAWLLLESHPDPRPPLYELARTRLGEAQHELNRTCSRLMLEVEMYYNQQRWDEARSTLDHVKAYFPNVNDQPCRRKAEQKRYEYRL
jgi:pSer/pThr/pTyr-binding forkhead associated (FHA) protein